MSTLETTPPVIGAENGSGPAGALPDGEGTWWIGQMPVIRLFLTIAGTPTFSTASSS